MESLKRIQASKSTGHRNPSLAAFAARQWLFATEMSGDQVGVMPRMRRERNNA
jgi:hypothetical protein